VTSGSGVGAANPLTPANKINDLRPPFAHGGAAARRLSVASLQLPALFPYSEPVRTLAAIQMNRDELTSLQAYADAQSTEFDLRTTVTADVRDGWFVIEVINAAAYSPQRSFKSAVKFESRKQAEQAIDAEILRAQGR